MQIGEISKKTGLTRDTIRFYEKKGLISVKYSKSIYNNYKNYTEENFNKLQLIKKAKSFGFTLNEAAELIELMDYNKANCSFFSDKVSEKLLDIDKKIQELEDMKCLILEKFENAKSSCNPDIGINCRGIRSKHNGESISLDPSLSLAHKAQSQK